MRPSLAERAADVALRTGIQASADSSPMSQASCSQQLPVPACALARHIHGGCRPSSVSSSWQPGMMLPRQEASARSSSRSWQMRLPSGRPPKSSTPGCGCTGPGTSATGAPCHVPLAGPHAWPRRHLPAGQAPRGSLRPWEHPCIPEPRSSEARGAKAAASVSVGRGTQPGWAVQEPCQGARWPAGRTGAGEKQALRGSVRAAAQRLLFGSLARSFLSWHQHAQARTELDWGCGLPCTHVAPILESGTHGQKHFALGGRLQHAGTPQQSAVRCQAQLMRESCAAGHAPEARGLPAQAARPGGRAGHRRPAGQAPQAGAADSHVPGLAHARLPVQGRARAAAGRARAAHGSHLLQVAIVRSCSGAALPRPSLVPVR